MVAGPIGEKLVPDSLVGHLVHDFVHSLAFLRWLDFRVRIATLVSAIRRNTRVFLHLWVSIQKNRRRHTRKSTFVGVRGVGVDVAVLVLGGGRKPFGVDGGRWVVIVVGIVGTLVVGHREIGVRVSSRPGRDGRQVVELSEKYVQVVVGGLNEYRGRVRGVGSSGLRFDVEVDLVGGIGVVEVVFADPLERQRSGLGDVVLDERRERGRGRAQVQCERQWCQRGVGEDVAERLEVLLDFGLDRVGWVRGVRKVVAQVLQQLQEIGVDVVVVIGGPERVDVEI